jgi:hypothetical protein
VLGVAESVIEPADSVERFTRNKPAKARYPIGDPLHFLLARRLIEAGVPVVHFNLGYWDWHGEQVTDKFYKIESFGRTLYHLLGIDADTLMHTPANRPVKLIVEDAPIIKEAIS